MKLITAKLVNSWLPPRKKWAHKGMSGRVYILAGSQGMIGAAVLCTTAALRSGAGLVRTGIVRSEYDHFLKRVPMECTSQALPEDKQGGMSFKAWSRIQKALMVFHPDVVAMGPGFGQGLGAKKIIHRMLSREKLPVVLDADGLNLLAQMKKIKFSGSVILTPHEQELSRLLQWPVKKISQNRLIAVRLAAQKFKCICLLKGPGTLISDGRTVYKNTTGNPGMATGGMGDVLTGMIASLWGQFEHQTWETGMMAASAGAYLHGRSADQAVQKFSERSLLASDIIDFIPTSFRSVLRRRNA